VKLILTCEERHAQEERYRNDRLGKYVAGGNHPWAAYWLGFLATCLYNAAHRALDIINALAAYGAINSLLWLSDARSHHQ